MAKVFNVDEFLKEKSVVIQLNGKDFEVTDIPFSLQKKIKDIRDNDENAEESIKMLLCELLGCSKEDLEPYGIRAFNAILEHIYSNFFPENSPKRASKS